MEVNWFQHICLSVCPSVKKWFLYNNSSSVWHTMMIFHIYLDLDPRRTSIDFGSKGQRWDLDFKLFLPFPHHSSIYFWHTIMILHKCIDLDLRRTSIDFWIKGQSHDFERLNLLPRRDGVPLKYFNFKWMWVGSTVNDIYVYTLSALVYRLNHDQTILKRTLSVKVRIYQKWLDK